jgi:hypothetical protein
MKAPLDDSEVYTSMSSLMEYCKSGTAYDGQKVAVNLKYFTQDFIIHSDSSGNMIPLIQLPNDRLEWKTVGGNHFVLVYYYNRSGKTFSSTDRFTYIEDPFAWSILDMIDIFKEAGATNYTFRLEMDDYAHHESVYNFTQDNPINVSGPNPSGASANVTSLGKHASNANAIITSQNTNIFLFPKNYTSAGSKNIVRLWVRANNYFSALGRE